ncbi:hypothetical protein MAC_01778 [Metarhizium acridum CQMa 102]|uniref:Biotrophy-associated secreted protein 2 n=1 Tax=Metarhizium acridum (strain CQMa 102) TaxID=655827 RepID=E9DVY0_METAQ|nr:uncharacterized protein MAC_01778 [Metarhizium acridum CQMa 102]EFY92177.1 hypothetical protein MAC_01778 [Metarhizium acridum CQMa 102]
MVRVAFVSLLSLAVTAYAAALDPSELKNVGAGNGKQFITGKCLSNADCSTNCCAGLNGGGVCSALSVATAAGKTGCGFVGNNSAAGGQNNGAAGNNRGGGGNNGGNGGGNNGGNGGGNNGGNGGNGGNRGGNRGGAGGDGAQNFGNGQGLQFITGVCQSDADCMSGCCAKTTKACAAPGAVGPDKCGFVA